MRVRQFLLHFRVEPTTPRACYIFKCGDKLLETVDKYRYLGIAMNEFLDFNVTVRLLHNQLVEHLVPHT